MKILALIPETEFCPPHNGGQTRVYHILRELGRHFEVHAVSGQSTASINAAPPAFKLPSRIRLYSPVESPSPPDRFDLLPTRFARAARYRWVRRDLRGPASGFLLDVHHLVSRLLRQHAFDVVLLIHLDAMALAPLIRRLSPTSKLIIDCDNVNYVLLAQQFEADPDNAPLGQLVDRVRTQEASFTRTVDAFFACSKIDQIELLRLNGDGLPGFVIPNGVDASAKAFDEAADKHTANTVLFCGGLDYMPNLDGLIWFYTEVWPLVQAQSPGLRLRIIGRNSGVPATLAPMLDDPSVEFLGEAESVTPHYAAASVSVVPLRMGSGTRLKILESMAFGVPVVSTSRGAQGIGYQDGVDIRVADEASGLAEAICTLTSRQDVFERQRRNARRLVEETYDWPVIGQRLCEALTEVANA